MLAVKQEIRIQGRERNRILMPGTTCYHETLLVGYQSRCSQYIAAPYVQKSNKRANRSWPICVIFAPHLARRRHEMIDRIND